MAWIESHQELGMHPKTRRLARMLGVSVPAAVGHLHLLWWWALDYAQDGDLERFDGGDIADACLWEGDPDTLVTALREAGFLDDGRCLHDWDDYAGKLIESRARNAGRGRSMRQAYTDGSIAEVRNRDGDSCRYCSREVDWTDRKTAAGGTYDHIIPGGPTTPENLVVACRGCNSRKGSRTPEQAGMTLVQSSDVVFPASDAHLTTVPYPTEQNPTEPDRTEPEATPPLALRAPMPPDAPAPKAPRARKAGPEPLTPEQRALLLDSFAALPDVEGVLDAALNHRARDNCKAEYPYCRNWLRRELEEHEVRMARAGPRRPATPPPDDFATRKARYG